MILAAVPTPSTGDYAQIIAGILALLAIALGALFRRWNKKRGNAEAKAPTALDAWRHAQEAEDELDMERDLRRFWEDVADILRRLVRRLLAALGSSAPELTDDERRALTEKPVIKKPKGVR